MLNYLSVCLETVELFAWVDKLLQKLFLFHCTLIEAFLRHSALFEFFICCLLQDFDCIFPAEQILFRLDLRKQVFCLVALLFVQRMHSFCINLKVTLKIFGGFDIFVCCKEGLVLNSVFLFAESNIQVACHRSIFLVLRVFFQLFQLCQRERCHSVLYPLLGLEEKIWNCIVYNLLRSFASLLLVPDDNINFIFFSYTFIYGRLIFIPLCFFYNFWGFWDGAGLILQGLMTLWDWRIQFKFIVHLSYYGQQVWVRSPVA